MSQKENDKKLPEAENEFHTALNLNPSLSMARYNLGIALLKMHKDDDGIAELKAYIALPDALPENVLEARRIIVNPKIGRETPAPNFTVTTLEGKPLSLTDLRGQVVLLDFWGTWCEPCRESVPILQGIYKDYATKGFQIVGISSDTDESAWQTFVKRNAMTWPEYLDLSGRILFLYQVHEFPTFVILDRDGAVSYRWSGFDTGLRADLRARIDKILQ